MDISFQADATGSKYISPSRYSAQSVILAERTVEPAGIEERSNSMNAALLETNPIP
jgi:hypothetical protein